QPAGQDRADAGLQRPRPVGPLRRGLRRTAAVGGGGPNHPPRDRLRRHRILRGRPHRPVHRCHHRQDAGEGERTHHDVTSGHAHRAHSRSSSATMAGMTPEVIQRWLQIVESGDTEALDDLLADDSVFTSPAVFTPQQGKKLTSMYLTAAMRLFAGTDFRYVGQWYAENSAVLAFTTEIDDVHVNGIDMIQWNESGQIVSVKVMLRPYKALQIVIPKMAELLQG